MGHIDRPEDAITKKTIYQETPNCKGFWVFYQGNSFASICYDCYHQRYGIKEAGGMYSLHKKESVDRGNDWRSNWVEVLNPEVIDSSTDLKTLLERNRDILTRK